MKTPNGGYALQSFHGTRLVYVSMANKAPSPVHIVATPWDQGAFFNFFGTNGKFASELVPGGKIQIQMRPNETMTLRRVGGDHQRRCGVEAVQQLRRSHCSSSGR